MKTAIDSGAQNVLILEDDVDAEFNLVDKWKEMRRGLDKRGNGWDMVYLGFIWGDEKVFKPTFHPGLRQTNGPSGYIPLALTLSGRTADIRSLDLPACTPTLFLIADFDASSTSSRPTRPFFGDRSTTTSLFP